jgi:hypothetical protein
LNNLHEENIEDVLRCDILQTYDKEIQELVDGMKGAGEVAV